MFLHKSGASGNFTFDIIYSAFQKLMRRGEISLCLELAKEFKNNVNAFKKRLIYNVSEDICNLELIELIYNTDNDLTKLAAFVPICCNALKCRDGLYAFRIACEKHGYNYNEITDKDDLITAMIKLKTKIALGKTEDILNYYELKYGKNILKKIYEFSSKNRCCLYALIVYDKVPLVREKYDFIPALEDFNPNEIKKITLPDYVYDKHTAKGHQMGNSSYKYFLDNIILIPKIDATKGTVLKDYKNDTIIEHEAKALYLASDKKTSEFLTPITEPPRETPPFNHFAHKVLQVQLITAKNKPKTYYYDLNDNGEYEFILKGPMDYYTAQRNILSDKLKADMYLKNQNMIYRDGYLISDNFIIIDPKDVKTVSSKLEKDVILYNGLTGGCTSKTPEIMNDDELNEFIYCLLFRKVIGTNDTTFRNFLYVGGHVITIDDPILNVDTPYLFKTKLNEKVANVFIESFERFPELYKDFLYDLEETIYKAPYLSEFLKNDMIKRANDLMDAIDSNDIYKIL